jgi:hypothetical protein
VPLGYIEHVLRDDPDGRVNVSSLIVNDDTLIVEMPSYVRTKPLIQYVAGHNDKAVEVRIIGGYRNLVIPVVCFDNDGAPIEVRPAEGTRTEVAWDFECGGGALFFWERIRVDEDGKKFFPFFSRETQAKIEELVKAHPIRAACLPYDAFGGRFVYRHADDGGSFVELLI